MKIQSVIFFILMISSKLCLSQANKHLTDSLLNYGHLKALIKDLQINYKNDSLNEETTYQLASSYALDKQIDSAFYYLNIATKNDSSVNTLNDPNFYYLIKDKRWSNIEKELIAKTEAKFGIYKNLEFAKALWDLRIKDQAFYYHIKVATKYHNWDSPVSHALWDLKYKINEEAVADLELLIARYGWPKKSEVKGLAAQAAFLVIQHADLEKQKTYLPMIKAAANKNEASWSSLALMIDRVNIREGKSQIYGTQFHKNESNEWVITNLREPEYVNKRRKKVGLPPIEDMAKQYNIKWSVKQKD